MKNSLFDVISKAVITLVFAVTSIMMCVSVHNISSTLEQIQECEYQIKEYPVLKNIEVQTEKVDSLMQSLGK